MFPPRVLTNLSLKEELQSLCCITDMKISDLKGEGNPQIYSLCAAGPRSSLRVLRHGLSVTELGTSDLPGKPLVLWTVRGNINERNLKYMILSFETSTLVLSIGEKISIVHDSGIETTTQTLHVNLLEDNAIV